MEIHVADQRILLFKDQLTADAAGLLMLGGSIAERYRKNISIRRKNKRRRHVKRDSRA